MSTNWAYNLDMLAQNGVIDFDAPSYVIGQNPRYIGNPASISPFVGQPPQAPLLNQKQIDEFQPSTPQIDNGVKNPAWKKWLFGAVAVGTIIFAGFKSKSIGQWIKKSWNKVSSKLSWQSIKKGANSVGTSIKNGWNKFIGLFKKKKP